MALNRRRAGFELQLGTGFLLTKLGRAEAYYFPVEFLDEAQWKRFSTQSPFLLLTAARARILGLGNHPVRIDASKLGLEQLWELTASAKITTPKGSIAPEESDALLSLAKQAGILPALLALPSEAAPADTFSLSEEDLRAPAMVNLMRGETVQLPLSGAEGSTLTSFRDGPHVHLALTIGKESDAPPLVRVHSSCVTGDLLGSLRCDCGDQLQQALSQMKEDGAGVLLYLHQEGRGIGITSKLRAYALQEQGFDTFEANQQLGFEEDERDFAIAAAILSALGHKKIRLLTNNPDKVKAFSGSGIEVTKRLPLLTKTTAHNEAYIEAKHTKRGHHRHS